MVVVRRPVESSAVLLHRHTEVLNTRLINKQFAARESFKPLSTDAEMCFVAPVTAPSSSVSYICLSLQQGAKLS